MSLEILTEQLWAFLSDLLVAQSAICNIDHIVAITRLSLRIPFNRTCYEVVWESKLILVIFLVILRIFTDWSYSHRSVTHFERAMYLLLLVFLYERRAWFLVFLFFLIFVIYPVLLMQFLDWRIVASFLLFTLSFSACSEMHPARFGRLVVGGLFLRGGYLLSLAARRIET